MTPGMIFCDIITIQRLQIPKHCFLMRATASGIVGRDVIWNLGLLFGDFDRGISLFYSAKSNLEEQQSVTHRH